MSDRSILQTQQLEMRRGTIVLALLSQLETAQYGYDLLQKLKLAAFVIDAGTLYPLLRRLENQGILASSWDTTESRPRKYYRLSPEGKVFYTSLKREWNEMTTAINSMTRS
jgi:DNA-binding PadR family transcriptional regulator